MNIAANEFTETNIYTWNCPNDVCLICGKPRFYAGDYFGGPKPWCTCSEKQIEQQAQEIQVGITVNMPQTDDPKIDEWSPDPDVDCALPDLRFPLYALLGAVVIVCAVAVWGLRKLRTW